MSCFGKFKERLPCKEIFSSFWTGKKIIAKSMSMFLRFGIDLNQIQ